MKPVVVVNRLMIKPGKIDEFIETQQKFVADRAAFEATLGRIGRNANQGTADLVTLLKTSPLETVREAIAPWLAEEAKAPRTPAVRTALADAKVVEELQKRLTEKYRPSETLQRVRLAQEAMQYLDLEAAKLP